MTSREPAAELACSCQPARLPSASLTTSQTLTGCYHSSGVPDMLRSWLGFRKACLISSATLSGQLTAEIQCWVSDETAKVWSHALREIQI